MSTGVEKIQAICDERADPPSGIRTLGLDGTHKWITTLEPGHVEFTWPIDERHHNLEGAVICSWTIAVADQAMFFAGLTLCGEGEATRMSDLHFQAIDNITSGPMSVDARIERRIEDRMYGTCTIRDLHGQVAARAAIVLDVVTD